MSYRWSKEVAAAEADAWEDRLFSLGVENIVVSGAPGGQQLLEAFFDDRQSAESFREEFGGAVEELVEQNWAPLSCEAARRRTIKIRDHFIVTLDDDPDFLDELRAENPDRELLTFPPDMAFGTGDHETTTTCLELLVDSAPAGPWSFLDLGTGTGILAIAAHMLGAERIVAADFDPKAIEVAQKCLARHQIAPDSIELLERDVLVWEPSERFNIVAANLFSDVLIQAMPKIRSSVIDGGLVMLSGILREQLLAVERAAQDCGLEILKAIEVGKWASLLITPSSDPSSNPGPRFIH